MRVPAGQPALAGGGVLWRQDALEPQVALVHRPRYEDWTLPKGKPKADEQLLLAAVREVGEETGAEVAVGRRLPTVQYPLPGAGSKRVCYWSMRYLAGEHAPGPEVDQLRWLSVAEAAARLSYPAEQAVLADFARLPAGTTSLLLIRHAKAGKRSDFDGDDRLRPLDKIGRRHARESARLWAAFRPERVVAADRRRCEQTVSPLADRLGLPVSSRAEFSDEAFVADPARAARALWELAEQPGATVICSQGKAIPGLLRELAVPAEDYPARKGSLWVLSLWQGRVLAADYYPRPNT